MYSGEGSPARQITMTATDHKYVMQGLNERLTNYMNKVREMKQAGLPVDPAVYYAQLKNLEEEIQKVRKLYDDELNRLRDDLINSNKENNTLKAQLQQYKTMQTQLADETVKARKAQDEAHNLRKELAQKEQELLDHRNALKQRDNELDQIRPGFHKVKAENDDLRKRNEQESVGRKAAEDKVKQLHDKAHFDAQKTDHENRDHQERLKAANDLIRTLEDKIRQLQKKDAEETARQMQKMRDANVAELRRIQQDTEDALNRNLSQMKKQMDDDARAKDELAKERDHLLNELRDVQKKNSEMQGVVAGLQGQNRTLQKALDDEKSQNQKSSQELHNRNRDLQDEAMNRLKEFNDARDAQASLRNEIQTYKDILDGEEGRVVQPVGGYQLSGTRPATTANAFGRAGPQYTSNNYGTRATTPQVNGTQAGGTATLGGGTGGFNRNAQGLSKAPLTTYRADYGRPGFKPKSSALPNINQAKGQRLAAY